MSVHDPLSGDKSPSAQISGATPATSEPETAQPSGQVVTGSVHIGKGAHVAGNEHNAPPAEDWALADDGPSSPGGAPRRNQPSKEELAALREEEERCIVAMWLLPALTQAEEEPDPDPP